MTQGGNWVFGYGSLIWHPGFAFRDRVVATLEGYHRTFCMRSIHHRGTEDDPGLVLALDEALDARCLGLAFEVEHKDWDGALNYLRERELISSAYVERNLHLTLADGREVPALAYVIDAGHVQYCGGLPLEEQARIISQAVGGRGPNTEYLFNTTENLAELGIDDPDMQWLSQRVRELIGA